MKVKWHWQEKGAKTSIYGLSWITLMFGKVNVCQGAQQVPHLRPHPGGGPWFSTLDRLIWVFMRRWSCIQNVLKVWKVLSVIYHDMWHYQIVLIPMHQCVNVILCWSLTLHTVRQFSPGCPNLGSSPLQRVTRSVWGVMRWLMRSERNSFVFILWTFLFGFFVKY